MHKTVHFNIKCRKYAVLEYKQKWRANHCPPFDTSIIARFTGFVIDQLLFFFSPVISAFLPVVLSEYAN